LAAPPDEPSAAVGIVGEGGAVEPVDQRGPEEAEGGGGTVGRLGGEGGAPPRGRRGVGGEAERSEALEERGGGAAPAIEREAVELGGGARAPGGVEGVAIVEERGVEGK
jgi:hypothetical protein